MFNFFTKTATACPVITKGYKVTRNSERSKKYGIAASSLEMLRTKIVKKFNLKLFNLFLSDGSLIEDEDYFQSIPAQTLIIVAEDGEDVKTGEFSRCSKIF